MSEIDKLAEEVFGQYMEDDDLSVQEAVEQVSEKEDVRGVERVELLKKVSRRIDRRRVA